MCARAIAEYERRLVVCVERNGWHVEQRKASQPNEQRPSALIQTAVSSKLLDLQMRTRDDHLVF